MPRTGADLFVQALEAYGVDYLFGNPGTTELPIMAALEDSALEYILGLHEDIAVATAAGYASTRRYHAHDDPSVQPVGVVNLHVAPGVAHGLGNLMNAARGGVPLVVTAGEAETDHLQNDPVLSGDLETMTRQYTKWSAEVPTVDALPGMLRRAFRTALTPPTGPVFLGLPLNVTMAETDGTPERLGTIPDAGRGDAAAVEQAASALVEATAPVMIVGDQVARADAVSEAVAVAEATGARVHGEILASEVAFPSDHPQFASYIPPSDTAARRAMAGDLVWFVGCSTHTTITKPNGPLVPAEATLVHVGPDAGELGKTEPSDIAVVGDLKAILGELTTILEDRVPADERVDRLERVAAEMAEFAFDQPVATDADRLSKARLVDVLSEAAGDAFLVDEAVTSKYVMLNRRPLAARGFIGNKGAGLGYGLAAAIGAALAEQDGTGRDVIGFVGDGSFLYYPHALYTAARYGIDLTVVIPDNRNYRILKDNMLSLLGGEEADYAFEGMDFEPPIDLAACAETFGATGRVVDSADALREAIEEARRAAGPTVLDVPVHD